jgi:hypothetical protein
MLAGSGLAVDARGVVCDTACRALSTDGVVLDDVFVAGDVRPEHQVRRVPTFADQVALTQGSLAERRFAAAYGRPGAPSPPRSATCSLSRQLRIAASR